MWGLGVLGDLGFLAGDPDLARAATERSVQMSEPLGVLARQIAHSRLGRQLLLEGRATEAADVLEYAQSFSRDGNRTVEPFIAQALAQARLEAGEPARAFCKIYSRASRRLSFGDATRRHRGESGTGLAR